MVSIRNSINTNRRLLILVSGLLITIIVLIAVFFSNQRKENRALKLKLITMSENRRAPKAWSQILTPPKLLSDTTKTTNASTATVNPNGTSANVDSAELPLVEQDTQTLAAKLDSQMRNVQSLDLPALDNNIDMANEIISREPDSDIAYKAKLISLLVKEGKYKQTLDENEVNRILEDMAQFKNANSDLDVQVAAYDSVANSSLQNSETTLAQISEDRSIFEAQLSELEPNSPERASILESLKKLQTEEEQALKAMNETSESHDTNIRQLMSEEIVEIPLKRMMANGNYEEVADNAQSLIDQFPNSPDGYFYLLRSLELQGQKEEAVNLLQNAQLTPETRDALLKKLDLERSQDPQLYWQNLKF
jgi:hypothetical protein